MNTYKASSKHTVLIERLKACYVIQLSQGTMIGTLQFTCKVMCFAFM